MKKNVLSLSIATMIGSLGLSGPALAGIAFQTSAVASTALNTDLGATNATSLDVNDRGIGHNLLVPYYTVQEGNGTLLSIINTDTKNGKAVKVRFRGASNSDDVFDFTLLMSPGDVWTAHVTKEAKSGLAQINTPDNSCTLPSNKTINGTKFVTARVYGLDDAAKAAETREGYVEIFNMADIPPQIPGASGVAADAAGATATANPLFTAIKHDDKGANPCSSATDSPPAAVAKLKDDPTLTNPTVSTDNDAARTADRNALLNHGLWAPTTGLTGTWTILNITGASVAWSGNMTAIEAHVPVGGVPVPARGRVVFSPQQPAAVPNARVNYLTADPLLRNTGDGTAAGVIPAKQFDFPDMSTPYLVFGETAQNALAATSGYRPVQQANELTKTLAVKNVINEYITNPAISAATDWVFSMPTRRYAVGVDYKGSTATATPALVFNIVADHGLGTGTPSRYFTSRNTSIGTDGSPKYQACVEPGGSLAVYDQEEAVLASSEFTISPGAETKKVQFCGETSVLSFNMTSALKAALATKNVDTGKFSRGGWVNINTAGLPDGANATLGLPIVGSAFVKITGPKVAGNSSNFSITQPHRFIKP